MATREFDGVMKFCHWTTVLLVAALFVLGWIMYPLPSGELKSSLYNWHKTTGITVILLTLFRLSWRLTHPIPALPSELPMWEKIAAPTSHFLLYTFLIVQPLTGMTTAALSPSPNLVLLFDVIPIPFSLTPNESLQTTFSFIHFYSSWAFFTLIAIHILAALRHHFILKNNILRRMLPKP